MRSVLASGDAGPLAVPRRSALAASAVVLAAVYVAVAVTGGAPGPLANFAYVAVILASLAAGAPGGVVAGIAAGLLLGPLTREGSPASAGSLGQWGWVVRLGAYCTAGWLVGWAWSRARRVWADALGRHAADQAADRARGAEARLEATLEAAADGIVVLDPEGRIARCNAAAAQLLSAPLASLVGRTPREAVTDLGAAVAPGGEGDVHEITLRAPGGTRRIVEVRASDLGAGGTGGGRVLTLHDATARHVLEAQRQGQLAMVTAAVDAVAGAPSASAAAEALLDLTMRDRPVVAAALYLFTGDSVQRLAAWTAPGAVALGAPAHPPHAGPELRRLALRGPLRVSLDDLPSRPEAADSLAAQGVRTVLIVPVLADGELAGAVMAATRAEPEPLAPDEAAHLQELVSLAGAVLRRAHESEEATRALERQRIEAILARPRLLEPHYQPIVSLSGTRVAGYEALARFRAEPARPPDGWFAAAERAGLGAELQALALRRARSVARAAGLPAGAFLSINVSPRHLADPGVAGILGAGSLDRLVIELTEQEAVTDYDALRQTLAPYRARGARLAVDDAGAGFASMRHVTELRPDIVKLDAQLVRGIADDHDRRASFDAFVGFARAVGAVPIAEGVEWPGDLAILARIRRPLLVQGYAIARPGPPWPDIQVAGRRLAAAGRYTRTPGLAEAAGSA